MHEKLIAELEKYIWNFADLEGPRMQDGLIHSAASALREDAGTIADLRAKLKKAGEESSEYEKALDAVWVNDGKWNYETHQERDTGVQGFTIATGDIESNTYKRLVHNAESPLDAILAALKEGK